MRTPCHRCSRTRRRRGWTWPVRAPADPSPAEYPMDHLDADRSFADRRGHALDVARANVADGEDTQHAGLEQVRATRERPVLEVLRSQVRPGLDEALVT